MSIAEEIIFNHNDPETLDNYIVIDPLSTQPTLKCLLYQKIIIVI